MPVPSTSIDKLRCISPRKRPSLQPRPLGNNVPGVTDVSLLALRPVALGRRLRWLRSYRLCSAVTAEVCPDGHYTKPVYRPMRNGSAKFVTKSIIVSRVSYAPRRHETTFIPSHYELHYTLCLKKSSHLYTLCNFVKY